MKININEKIEIMNKIRVTNIVYLMFCRLRKVFTGHTESELIKELIEFYNKSSTECTECGALITDNYNKKDFICDNCTDALVKDSENMRETYKSLAI